MRRHQLTGTTRGRAALLALTLALGFLACALDRGTRAAWIRVAPQQWQKERGPVVPHDSFPRDCSLCHTGSGWHEIRADFRFDHAAETGHPLSGAHEAAECLRCHNDRGPVEVFAQRGCMGCHVDPHGGKLGGTCASCHDETDWRPKEDVAMHARTRFPLVGAHAAAACWSCHPGAQVGNFDRTSTECIACHRDDLAQATSPDHVAQGWVDDCQRCHLPTSWSDAGIAHDFFPLVGGHGGLTCTRCHPGNVFEGTPSACFACHQDDYRATRDPDHQTAGFSTTCENCHNVFDWGDARFTHGRWPLTGAHAGASCNACHGGGVYRGTPTTCIDCHADDYQGAPGHGPGGFSNACEDCHSTSGWRGASFSHPQFPITRGRHSGLSCVQCHPSAPMYSSFTCTDCHAHTQRDMNDEHDRVRGYVYQSSACLSCHPSGQR